MSSLPPCQRFVSECLHHMVNIPVETCRLTLKLKREANPLPTSPRARACPAFCAATAAAVVAGARVGGYTTWVRTSPPSINSAWRGRSGGWRFGHKGNEIRQEAAHDAHGRLVWKSSMSIFKNAMHLRTDEAERSRARSTKGEGRVKMWALGCVGAPGGILHATLYGPNSIVPSLPLVVECIV